MAEGKAMCVADIPCMNRGVWGHIPSENFLNLKTGNAISCIPSVQICSKFYANDILVFEIKEGKKRTKGLKKY
jgi:hypothetical protein